MYYLDTRIFFYIFFYICEVLLTKAPASVTVRARAAQILFPESQNGCATYHIYTV